MKKLLLLFTLTQLFSYCKQKEPEPARCYECEYKSVYSYDYDEPNPSGPGYMYKTVCGELERRKAEAGKVERQGEPGRQKTVTEIVTCKLKK